jgi:BirA family biotin operon repressor/biotin-[acetyl-CoA-carboxylase] ligase
MSDAGAPPLVPVPVPVLGRPRMHLRVTDSTNARAHELAGRGAPHGMLVTAGMQTAGRGRQGRTWSAPPGRALLCSLIVRRPPPLLSLAAGVAVAEVAAALAGETRTAAVKWPNDVLLDGRKLAGILVEGRPQEDWAVVGIGLNVALQPADLPPDVQATAATLGLGTEAIEPTLSRLLHALGHWLAAPANMVLDAVRARDALRGQTVRWAGGQGRAIGIDEHGRLQIHTGLGTTALDAGEVHLLDEAAASP